MRISKTANGMRHIQQRRGSVLIYSFYLMIVMFAFVSFGVDFGHVQAVKTELQRSADATARGTLQLYLTFGSTYAVQSGPYLGLNQYNPVDSKSGLTPTVSVTWGSWNAFTNTFTPGGSSPVAVKVVISRTKQTGNSVKLTFPLINGKSPVTTTCDVWAQSIAYISGNTTATATVSGLSDPWLAGMPNGSAAVSDLDTAPSNSPGMVMSVTPGTVLTFTNVSGGVKNDPNNASYDTPDGNTWAIHSHNDDDPLNEPAVQNNIGNISAPLNAMLGLFLTNTEPDLYPAPTVARDYSTQAERDQAVFSDIQIQQPFFIGDGKTSGGTTQTFVVPQGATRLYLGTMDGHQWWNNAGSFTATINQQQQIYLVK